MVQTVRRRPLTAEARLRCQFPRDLWWTKLGLGQVFSSKYFGFPMSVSFHQCSLLVFIYTLLLSEGQTGEAWEPSKKLNSSEIGKQ